VSFVLFCVEQLVSHCVDVLVTAFKDTIIAECPQMIKNNETESTQCYLIFSFSLHQLNYLCQYTHCCFCWENYFNVNVKLLLALFRLGKGSFVVTVRYKLLD